MTTHITQYQVEALLHKLAPVREPEFWSALCNAAIQHYINSQQVRVPMTDADRKTAWYSEHEAHRKGTAYAQYCAGIRRAEAHHGIKEIEPDWMRDDAEDEQTLMDRDMGDN